VAGGHPERVDHDYDLIVIGGGAAGLAAAQAGAAAKARTLLVAEGETGGECTFTGCVPSKTLIEAAARGAGFTEAMTAVRKTVAAIAATESADVLTRRGIGMLRGHAEFTAPRQVAVDGRTLLARGFVLAAGSRPAVPPVPGLAGTPYLTNENLFELDRLPGSLAIVGGRADRLRDGAGAAPARQPGHADRGRAPAAARRRPGSIEDPR
jgi:pyruvate/2-oxoglutarate dehydrogenase complex dihydrolipoamide dehydrogenase (E3) component